MSPTGRVHFQVPTVPWEAGKVVEVRDKSLNLVARARSYESVELEPGVYLTRAVLPNGEEPEQLITITPGEDVNVQLGRQDGVQSNPEPLLDVDLPEQRVTITAGAADAAATPAPEWFGRFLSIPLATPDPEPPALEPVQRHPDASRPEVSDFICTARAERISCLQVAVPGHVPFNCILPMLPAPQGPEVPRCRVRVIATSQAIRASATPVSSLGPVVESVASYVVMGHLHHAAEIAENARDLLLDKLKNPIGAALGGYALLRLGRLWTARPEGGEWVDDEETRRWATNLANWFPALPDGAVIAGELAARSATRSDDDVVQAHKWMREAARRGVPVLADGLSLLSARLREWRNEPSRPSEPTRQGELAERAFERQRRRAWTEEPPDTPSIDRLLAISLIADFTQLTTAFADPDPIHPGLSREPITDFDPAQGWRAFRYGEPVAVVMA